MDEESKIAVRLLEAIALVNRQLLEAAITLRRRPEVIEVFRELECHKLQATVFLDITISVELKSGNAVIWRLEIECDEDWRIFAEVVTSTVHTQIGLKEFPDKTTSIYSEFLDQLKQSASELIASADTIDLSTI